MSPGSSPARSSACPAGGQRHVDHGLVRGGPAPGGDAGALPDPLVAGVDPLADSSLVTTRSGR